MAWVNGKRTVRCRECWDVGHNRRNCPKLSPERKAEYATGALARKCSYCAETGHNRKGCAALKSDKVRYVKENSEYRHTFLAKLREGGINVGALMECRTWPERKALAMLTRIRWDNVAKGIYGNYRTSLEVRYLGEDDGEGTQWVNAPFSTDPYNDYKKSVCVSGSDRLEWDVPPGWLDGADPVEEFFNGKARVNVYRRMAW